MENKPKIPVYDREPSPKAFKRSILITMIFIVFYGGFLIWKNYYREGAEPPIQRKQLSVPQPLQEDTSAKK
ncbi:hypothetical protein QQ054_26520 [Oscillatoria amoena NRMC-F 0135]|nr:hypothetical protein [Oscillatoria amoena NRMC-F 0135]